MLADMLERVRQGGSGLLRGVLLAGVVLAMGACVHGRREAFFEARAAVVSPREGDGSARMALWPMTADRHAQVSRLTESREPNPGR
ncbi:MAG: hypothetical protein HBSAPP03_25980 [Phycisphaerae bacterium]|nr:MAG: hypothetical protein HBSAPP03_25980 [Phycisphaerae bacterium]